MKTKLLLFLVVLLLFGSTITAVTGCNCNNRKIDIKDNDSNEYALGLIAFHDKNSSLILNPVTLEGDHPSKWDWRHAEYNGTTGDWTTGIRNQRNCGSCWVFPAIAALETVYNIQKGDPDIDLDLSEQMIVSCGSICRPPLDGCCGGFITEALNFLKKIGTVTETCFPYRGVDYQGRDYQDCRNGGSSHAPVRCEDKCSNWTSEIIKIEDWKALKPLDPDSIKNAIFRYGPVTATLEVYLDFYSYSGGIYKQKSKKFVGLHAVLIVGYDDEQKCWICKNSWGQRWGEPNPYDPSSKGGWFRIKYGECSIEDWGTAYIVGLKKPRSYNNLPIIFESLLNKILKNPLFVFLIN